MQFLVRRSYIWLFNILGIRANAVAMNSTSYGLSYKTATFALVCGAA